MGPWIFSKHHGFLVEQPSAKMHGEKTTPKKHVPGNEKNIKHRHCMIKWFPFLWFCLGPMPFFGPLLSHIVPYGVCDKSKRCRKSERIVLPPEHRKRLSINWIFTICGILGESFHYRILPGRSLDLQNGPTAFSENAFCQMTLPSPTKCFSMKSHLRFMIFHD